MIIGTGLIARSLTPYAELLDGIHIHAAGVSNSSCKDATEFARDRLRLQQSIAKTSLRTLFVYISTCSIDDPSSNSSQYVMHKRDLELITLRREGASMIARLPQVAGSTPNPHTILNYLYARIARSERFDLWQRATRNVIDADDVGQILIDVIVREKICSGIVNIANPSNSSIREIVGAFEKLTNRQAIFSLLDKGADHHIDLQRTMSSLQRSGIAFDDNYLVRTLIKYYSA